MNYRIFSEKEIEKQGKDLIELHKRCIKNYLVQRSLKYRKITKFFVVYDYYIGTSNIRSYFFRPVPMFVRYLLIGKLEDISDYIQHGREKKSKRNKRMVSDKSKTVRRKNGRTK